MSELGDLIEAAGLSPGKGGLLKAVIRAAEDAVEPEEAWRWLAVADPRPYDADVREFVANYLSDEGEIQSALRWVEGDEPALHLVRARILNDAGRTGEAASLGYGVKGPQLSMGDRHKHLY